MSVDLTALRRPSTHSKCRLAALPFLDKPPVLLVKQQVAGQAQKGQDGECIFSNYR